MEFYYLLAAGYVAFGIYYAWKEFDPKTFDDIIAITTIGAVFGTPVFVMEHSIKIISKILKIKVR